MRIARKGKRKLVFFGLCFLAVLGTSWVLIAGSQDRLQSEIAQAKANGLIVSEAQYLAMEPKPEDDSYALYKNAEMLYERSLTQTTRTILLNSLSLMPESARNWKANVKGFLHRAEPVTWKEIDAEGKRAETFFLVLDEASRRPRFFHREFRELLQLVRLNDFTKALASTGEAAAKLGKTGVAIEKFRTNRRIQAHIAQAPTLMAMLRACSLASINEAAVRRSILRLDNADDLDRFAAFCREPLELPSFRTALRTEPLTMLKDIDTMAVDPAQAGGLMGELTWKDRDYWRYGSMRFSYVGNSVKAKLLATLTSHYRQLPKDPNDLQGTRKVLTDLNAKLASDTSYAGKLSRDIPFDFSMVTATVGHMSIAHRMNQVLVELQREKLRTGSYPSALPSSATSILDPYSDHPFRYRRTGKSFIVYSVGENQVDDGGDYAGKLDVALLYEDGKIRLAY